MTFPKALKRRKKPKEYKLRGFVAMLFLAIVFLVGFAHVFYHQQVLQVSFLAKNIFDYNLKTTYITVLILFINKINLFLFSAGLF